METQPSPGLKVDTSSAYNANFRQKLIDLGVYPYACGLEDYPPAPKNLQEIRRRLGRRRASLSPTNFSDSDFFDFTKTMERAETEVEVMKHVFPIVAGPKDHHFSPKAGVLFGRLKPMAPNLVKPIPDIYYGAEFGRIDSRVVEAIGKYIVPSRHESRPAVPNFFVEGKSEMGRADVAMNQACYDGALGARAMHQLQNYGASAPVYDGNAYTITSTYHDGTLRMYATHPAEPKDADGAPQYYMTRLLVCTLDASIEDFFKGAAAYRNAREWAAEQRSWLIAAANDTARRKSAERASISSGQSSRISTSTVVDADLAESVPLTD
ncbi:MAG: hypothetical protein M1826_002850 [Phylliscum demangeonii]|nr:MAG: hypothetical protein M1826_002850 [Phylliscum demangeonii]